MKSTSMLYGERSCATAFRGKAIWVLVFMCACLFLRQGLCQGVSAGANTEDAWARIQQLAAGTQLKISAERKSGGCILQSASPDTIVCTRGSSTRSFARSEIKSIRLKRKGRSAAIGLGLGVGIGAGVGAGVGAGINSGDQGSLFHVSGSKATGVGAAVGAIVGGIAGALTGYATDLAAGPVLYKR